MKRRSFIGGAIAAVFAPLAPALKDMGLIRPEQLTGKHILAGLSAPTPVSREMLTTRPHNLMVAAHREHMDRLQRLMGDPAESGTVDTMEITKPTRIT